jgi:transcriptional regulator of acetoin/glycerol metabolism
MTFGKIKSQIERNLIESYKDETNFKKNLREFKQNVLNNKNISKVYSIYDQLSTPQGLSDSDAKEFLEEGINLLSRLIPDLKLPKSLTDKIQNNYSDIDTLVYTSNTNLSERVNSKKNIISILTKEKTQLKESINIPIKTMVNVANQTLKGYVESLDENSKKEFFQLISEDSKVLETKFEEMKVDAITKLTTILESSQETDVKSTVSETINKIKGEKFDQLNFLRIKNLVKSI